MNTAGISALLLVPVWHSAAHWIFVQVVQLIKNISFFSFRYTELSTGNGGRQRFRVRSAHRGAASSEEESEAAVDQ